MSCEKPGSSSAITTDSDSGGGGGGADGVRGAGEEACGLCGLVSGRMADRDENLYGTDARPRSTVRQGCAVPNLAMQCFGGGLPRARSVRVQAGRRVHVIPV
ncbi:hypothetical protein PLESTF_000573300 [Pleodorina starrii]|nr:hypothetical protein PLESTF_000573300 [Pleodorina starrii]